MPSEQPPLIDRLIRWLSPRAAAERAYYRALLDSPELLASYRGGVATRIDRPWPTSGLNQFGLRSDQRQRFIDMRHRARQLEADNALAAALLDRSNENVIGTQISMRSASADRAWRAAVDDAWRSFSARCDVRGMLDFAGLQQLMFRMYERDGDAGLVLIDRGGEPRLQLLESDRITTPDGMHGKPGIYDGVEVDAVGRPVAFHVLEETEFGKRQWQRITARNFVFLANIRRPHQVRGLTKFAQLFTLFDLIWGYLEATVVAARVGAAQALIVKRPQAGTIYSQLATATNSQGKAQAIQTIEPGMIHYLPVDGDVVGFNPTQPAANFPDAIATFARFVGLNFGLTLEQVLLDFSRTSYSSARAARLQAEQTAYCEQAKFYQIVLRRVWKWWLDKAIATGALPSDPPADYDAHEWIPQGRPWIDPTKEVQAALMAIDAGLETRSNVALSQGYTFEELVERNRADRAMMAEAGLPVAGSTLTRDAQTAPTPQREAQPATEQENDDENS